VSTTSHSVVATRLREERLALRQSGPRRAGNLIRREQDITESSGRASDAPSPSTPEAFPPSPPYSRVMAAKLSAGLLPYRWRGEWLEVFLVHPGGPFWASKDDGAWSIAKGEYEHGEDPWRTALREWEEEIGQPAPSGEATLLGEYRQASGKRITAFAIGADFEVDEVVSNTFTMEWPPRSGVVGEFPEVDRAEWMTLDVARKKLIGGQQPFLDRLEQVVRTAEAP
jgi:predicted NUDIX family NTP pyrophosphohydrolase